MRPDVRHVVAHVRVTQRRVLAAIHVAALVATVGCHAARVRGAGAPPEGVEARAVRGARLAQNRAIAAGELDRAAEYWTDDVTVRRGLGQPVTSRAAYRRLLEPSGPADSVVVYVRDPERVDVSDRWPLAYESGRWAGHLGRATGPVVIDGRYAAQWVRRDGRWLIRSEVFVALGCAGVGCAYAAVP